ncbi:MAG: quercetin dioxygenase-like cupin family protein [Parasphingorhabdus sp.]|jgi:hypothetical protein
MTRNSAVLHLLDQIKSLLLKQTNTTNGVSEVLLSLSNHLDGASPQVSVAPSLPSRLEPILDQSITAITSSALRPLVAKIRTAKQHLAWCIDDGLFYAKTADVGTGYLSGNMHTELIGPNGCVYQDNNFRLGLFMLAPATLYRDHAHNAPELYLNLTGPSGWRFNRGDWCDVAAGSVIWNPSGRVHATRIYQQAFLAVYSWTQDVSGPCRVVPASDWAKIEEQLTPH